MEKPIELCYASWKTRLRGAVHHLGIAVALLESCLNVAYSCEEHDPRREHIRAMQRGEPMSIVDILQQISDASDKLMEAEQHGAAAMKTVEKTKTDEEAGWE